MLSGGKKNKQLSMNSESCEQSLRICKKQVIISSGVEMGRNLVLNAMIINCE